MDNFNTEKAIWTEADFEQMGWHDNKIYAIGFGIAEYELTFDIDYIFKWIDPKGNENHFKFITSPATLVFRNVYDVRIATYMSNLVITDIYKDNPTMPKNAVYIKDKFEYDWTIETTNGEITFKSTGYTQFTRKMIQSDSQSIDLVVRGGISFDVPVLAQA